MGEVFPIGQDRQYLLTRAARHRHAGRYDQAMRLIVRAKELFEKSEDIEFELACIYDAMGCENEAASAYLRVAAMGEKLRAKALFHLSIGSAQNGDLDRAASYFEAFAATDGEGVSAEAVQLLQRQLLAAGEKKHARTRRQHAKTLLHRAAQRLSAGKIHAAKRLVVHSLALCETAQGHVLKACCHLITAEGQDAVLEAKKALALRPHYMQALCILADASMLLGLRDQARSTLIRAAFLAHSSDALLSVAIECAKFGLDTLTLVLTKRLLKRDPYHIRAMAMRACAFVNLGCPHSARKLFARLCVLQPEDSVFDAYYRALDNGRMFAQRLTLAQDVTEDEALARSLYLTQILHEDPDEVRQNESQIDEICRISHWAMHSPMAGANITLIAIIVLSVVNTDKTRSVLFEAMTDPVLDDGLKSSILHAITMHCPQKPEYADLGNRFVRLAAVTVVPAIHGAQGCQDVVQRAAGMLHSSYPDAADTLLEMWTCYLNKYGAVRGRMATACSCALEYAFHAQAGRNVSMRVIASRCGVSRRLAMLCVRRIMRAMNAAEKDRIGYKEE